MLSVLSIRDIVLIDRLDLDFATGLSVLTGETGAGKSILLDSLALALGARGDAGLVRNGQSQGQVTAVFDVAVDHPSNLLLQENEIEISPNVIMRRIQSADGRTKAYINDQLVGLNLLRDVGSKLVEIHGQHADRALIDSSGHRLLLDAFGGLERVAKKVSDAWKSSKSAGQALETFKEKLEESQRAKDYLRDSVEELNNLDPKPGEEAELAVKRKRMMQAEKIASDIVEAYESLNGEISPIPELSSLMRRLERKSDQSGGLLEDPLEFLGKAIDSLEDARLGFERALREAEFDPHELESTEVRLFALRSASRKYSVPADDLTLLKESMNADLASLESSEEKFIELKEQVAAANADLEKKAGQLSRMRKEVALSFESAVNDELPMLKLEQAKFVVDIKCNAESLSEFGTDQIEFWVQTNPGTAPGPLMKVASGGELSRFLLAIKVTLADRGSAPTLIFDEIDTGIGGAVSEAIGQRLSQLSENVQVLSITHAPQVAAKAKEHFLISKKLVEKERVATEVMRISDNEKLEEIARMLAGATITDEARAAAGRLIADEQE